jgi:hypothetical protein
VAALDQDLIPSNFEVMSPLLHRSYDRQQFSVVGVVVFLGGAAFARVECGRSEDADAVELMEDSDYCKAACVCLESDRLLCVKMLQNQGLGKCAFDLLDSYICSPVHSHVSLDFFSKSAIGGYLGMLLYEVPIEVHETHQHLYVFRGCGCRPIFTLNSRFSALQYQPYS